MFKFLKRSKKYSFGKFNGEKFTVPVYYKMEEYSVGRKCYFLIIYSPCIPDRGF